LAEVDEHLRAVAVDVPSFRVVLEGSATFRPVSQTSFIVVHQGADECEQVADRVRSGPLRRALTYPYHPHVTTAVDLSDVVHDRAEEKTAGFRLEFAVTAFERYELAEYGVWESIEAFGLQGARG
jgi:2'-5' RNA ligase